MTLMTIDLRVKIAAVIVITLVFISGLSIGQDNHSMQPSNERDTIDTLNYEVGIHDKLLDRYGDKIEAIDQRTIRLESSVDEIRSQIGVFNWIFGMCLLALLGALGETIYRRVIVSREKAGG